MSLTINSSNYSSIAGLFSSSSSSSSSAGIESLLGEYSSIKSGSYSKLLKSYYAKSSSSDSTSATEDQDTEKTAYSKVLSASESLSTATDTLLEKGSKSIWNKETTTDSDGNTTSDYDKDKIYSAISSFVNAYNDMVDRGQKSDNTGVLTQTAAMVTLSAKTASTLAQVGISITSSNHLSIDETFFKNTADMTTAKSLFNGTGSYGYSVASKASTISSYVKSSLADITGLKSYTSKGSYALSSSDALSSLTTSV